jgi:hypothetical protein
MRTLLNFIILLLIFGIVVFFPIFFSLALVSMLIVPTTWVYAQLTGQSYNFVIDQSDMLYKLNIFGQWALVIGGSLLLLSLLYI